jgi:hypothetical protein
LGGTCELCIAHTKDDAWYAVANSRTSGGDKQPVAFALLLLSADSSLLDSYYCFVAENGNAQL